MGAPARIGIIGTGRWSAQHHIPALLANPAARLVAVADPNPAKLMQIKTTFGVPHAFGSAAELCGSGLVNGVVIASPHVHHYPAASMALDSGLHVLLEKPMTLDPGQAWDLVERAEQAGLNLVVGYPWQFTKHVAAAQDLVLSGVLGQLRLLSGLFTSPRSHLYCPAPDAVGSLSDPDPSTYADPAVAGGGQGQTEATHALAVMLSVSGLSVTRVAAAMRNLALPVDVIDVMTLEFDEDAIATFATIGTVSPHHPVQREFRYYGDRGVLLHDLEAGQFTAHLYDGRRIDVGPDTDRYPTAAPSQCLVDLMTGGTDNPAPGELGARVVACLAAAYASAGRKGRPMPAMPAAAGVQLRRIHS